MLLVRIFAFIKKRKGEVSSVSSNVFKLFTTLFIPDPMSANLTGQKAPKNSPINPPEARLRAHKIRFAHMRVALEGLAERAATPSDGSRLELNLRLWDAFKSNNAPEMTRLVRAGARVSSIEDHINEEERSLRANAI